MVAAPWCLLRLGKGASHHDRVRAASQRLANIAAFAHTAVGDNWYIPRRFFKVSVTRCRAVDRGSNLRNAESKYTARGASGSGTNANQDCSRSAFHYLESHIVPDCVSYNHRDAHLATEFFKIERLILGRNVTDSGNRALHYENVCAGVLRNPAKFRSTLRNGTHSSYNTGVLDLADTRRDEILLNRFLVNSLQQRSNFRFTRVDDF